MPPARDVANLSLQSAAGELIFAVDTGGTKTAAWLVETLDAESHRILGHARTSAGNPLSVGFEKATLAIEEALWQVRKQSKTADNAVISRAVLSIAGAANRNMTERFVEWARTVGLAEQVAIVSDVLPILAAGTPNCCGMALISGTGSSAFARAADGSSKRCGGWGYLLGDEGSGYAIGRAALQLALAGLESQEPMRPLAEAVRTALGIASVTELTRTIYGNSNPRHAIAALAQLVTTAAADGDPDAENIVRDAATDLAQLVSRTAHSVGLANDCFPLALSGSVLIHSTGLQSRLQAELEKLNLSCAFNVVREPLAGCVRLAEKRFAGDLVNWHAT